MRWVDVRDFLLVEKNTPIVDVRSPSEFMEGHIDGAVNLPLFSDEERAQVGTTYTHTGRVEAIELGLDLVGPKLSSLAKEAKKLGNEGELKTHCWRGGMRSEKMAWLFEMVGLEVTLLKGGYKAFRQQLLTDFERIPRLLVLQGATGSGKTAILHELRTMGEQILDLEKRANHRGSAFGALGLGDQPSTAQFQNWLYADLLQLDTAKRIWIESESLSIGKVYLPETLWQNMNRSKVIEIKLGRAVRADRILKEYGDFSHDQLEESIMKIKNRFGGNRVNKALELLMENRMHEGVLLLLDYYDKAYTYSKNKYKEKETAMLETATGDAAENAAALINLANNLNL